MRGVFRQIAVCVQDSRQRSARRNRPYIRTFGRWRKEFAAGCGFSIVNREKPLSDSGAIHQLVELRTELGISQQFVLIALDVGKTDSTPRRPDHETTFFIDSAFNWYQPRDSITAQITNWGQDTGIKAPAGIAGCSQLTKIRTRHAKRTA